MAKKKKAQQSTRNTEFNSYTDSEKYIHSTTNVTATSTNPNIKLLDYNESIKKKGSDIIEDAKNNHTMTDNGFDVTVDTSNITSTTDYYIFGSPHKMVLDNHQQYNNCGIDSALNVLVTGGLKTISDQNKTETAFTKQLWTLGLAEDYGKLGEFDSADGGTPPIGVKEVFSYYGLTSKGYANLDYAWGLQRDGNSVSLKSVANTVRKGGAAVIAVSSNILWGKSTTDNTLNHAVSIIGVVYDKSDSQITDDTTPVGFYIHDTGGWMTRYISFSEMESVALSEKFDGVFGTVVETPLKKNTDNINATGTKDNNIIYGNSSDNVIKGVGGTNKLVGGAGNDTIYGGSGKDTIYANDENNNGGTSLGRNEIHGGGGADTVYGGNYNDLIYGSSGNDIIYGNSGEDALYGDKGNDTIYGGSGNDRISGGAGNDTLDGGDGYDTLIGGSGNDTIIGGRDTDRIECGSGNDTVIYNEGDGADVVTSSSGNVTFKFDKSASEIMCYMTKETKSTNYTLTMAYTEETGVDFEKFLNTKNNSCKTAYLEDKDGVKYRLGGTSASGKVKVKSSTGNNIFFATNSNSSNISTSKYDDIVYMISGNDKITYTAGKDKYISFAGNDTYVVDELNQESFLSIKDSTDSHSTSVSTDDVLKLNFSKNDFTAFFDMKKNGSELIIENNADLNIVSNSVWNNLENYQNITRGEGKGVISITEGYNGKGKMERIYTSDSQDPYQILEKIEPIKMAVTSWFNSYGEDYSSVYEAINDNNNQHLTELMAAYQTPQT